MSKEGIFATVASVTTAVVSLARDIVTIWRAKPEPRKADRTAADALRDAVERDRGDAFATLERNIVERSKR